VAIAARVDDLASDRDETQLGLGGHRGPERDEHLVRRNTGTEPAADRLDPCTRGGIDAELDTAIALLARSLSICRQRRHKSP
jgi:hypothetical protein